MRRNGSQVPIFAEQLKVHGAYDPKRLFGVTSLDLVTPHPICHNAPPSRSGITQMGHQVAQRLNLCAIGRATNKRFLCFSAPERLLLETELVGARLKVA